MATPTPNAPLSGLKLTFNENFDTLSINTGTAATKGNTWKTVDAWGNRTQHGPGQKQFYVDQDYYGLGLQPFSTNDGVLTIKAWPTPANAKSAVGGMPYVSGWLNTPDSFAQKYGYFEMRAQMPAAGKGMWPAFWLLNAPPKLYWPPEIDIMEAIGTFPTRYWTSIHTKDPGGNSGKENNVGVNIETSMHTYGVDWRADKIAFYFDGQKVYERATPKDMHDPMYMLLNLGIGGSWPGDPNSTTDWSKANYKVDYVRVWSADPNAKVHANAGSGDGGGTPTTPPPAPNTATAGNDILVGTAGNDVIDGLAGNDDVNGGAGNDTLHGGAGDDLIGGAAGDDVQYGGEGNDLLNGDGGSDLLIGGNGADIYTIFPNSGFDTIDNQHTDTATDRVILKGGITAGMVKFSQAGNDLVLTLDGNTATKVTMKNWFLGSQHQGARFELDDGTLVPVTVTADPNPTPNPTGATAGNDVLDGTSGIDVIDGLAGDDTISGFEANDTLTGGAGNDMLKAGAGNDTLIGGEGDDYLDGETGADRLVGGVGNDIFIVDDAGDVVVEAAGEGTDSVGTTLGSYTLGANLENLLYVGTGNFTGTGTGLANTLGGGNGVDILSGLGGDDTLAGGKGNDTLIGGAGADTYMFAEGSGMDTIDNQHTDSAADRVVLRDIAASAVTFAQVGHDLVMSLSGNTADKLTVKNWFLGSQYQVASFQLEDGTAVPVNVGTTPTDPTDPTDPTMPVATIKGTVGNNTLLGTMAADVIDGGAGNDTISGWGGSDTFIGGAGADTYRFGVTSGHDTIYNHHTDGAKDRVLLNAGIPASRLAFAKSGNDLVMTIKDSSDKLTVKDWFLGSQYQIDSFQLADGKVVPVNVSGTTPPTTPPTNPPTNPPVEPPPIGTTPTPIPTATINGTSGNNTLTGTMGNDVINGGAGNDTISGWGGNDTFIGGAGADTYRFGVGSGQDTIFNVDSDGSKDRILLNDGIPASRLAFAKSGNDLVMSINGTSDRLTVKDWFLGSQYQVDTVALGAGAGTVAVNVPGATTTMASASLMAAEGSEILVTDSSGSSISGSAGDDLITNRATGDVTLTGGAGKDVFDFVANAHASITDFNAGEDRLVLNGVSSSDVHVTTSTSGTLIDLGGGSTINLVGAALPKDQINITYA